MTRLISDSRAARRLTAVFSEIPPELRSARRRDTHCGISPANVAPAAARVQQDSTPSTPDKPADEVAME